MKNTFTLVISSLALLTSLIVSCADNTQKKTTTTAIAVSGTDQQLFKETSLHNLYLVKIAEEAITRSSLIETKDVAETILQDQASLSNDLTAFAGKRNIEIPLDISQAHLSQWQSLIREKGVAFDKKFLEIIAAEKDKTKSLAQKITKEASDVELKKIATNAITIANNHFDLATDARNSIDERRSRDTLLISVADSQ